MVANKIIQKTEKATVVEINDYYHGRDHFSWLVCFPHPTRLGGTVNVSCRTIESAIKRADKGP